MTAITTEPATPDQQRPAPTAVDPSRRVDVRRLKSPVAITALTASALGAVGMTLGTVVAGKLAENPTRGLVWLLAICLVGAAVVDTAGKIVWVGNSDRAEGRLREDLLRAALRQPLSALNEQAVGEVLDRIDDDTHEVGNLVRWQIWMLARSIFSVLPMWLVAGLTWWPSFILLPVLASVTWFAIRSLLGEISRRKVVEEMAWTDHAAVLEEGIAGRDDLRTSLGQAHVLRRVARLSADVHAKFQAVVDVESRLVRRAGVLLHNRRGQSGLWTYGISGDLPIVLLRISRGEKIEIVRQLNADPRIEYAQLNYIAKIQVSPSDPDYRYQWHYHGNGAHVEGSASPGGILFALRPDGSERWNFPTPDWIDSTVDFPITLRGAMSSTRRSAAARPKSASIETSIPGARTPPTCARMPPGSWPRSSPGRALRARHTGSLPRPRPRPFHREPTGRCEAEARSPPGSRRGAARPSPRSLSC